MMSRKGLGVLMAGVGIVVSSAGHAFNLPAVNLGFTSFLDGGPPAGPGWYAQQYVQFYRGATIRDAQGRARLFPSQDPTDSRLRSVDVDMNIGLTQLLYQSDQPLAFGGKWGLNLMLPYASFDLDPGDTVATANSGALGDILIGPYLQWDPIMGPNGPRFMHRIELQMIFPTGDYDSGRALNVGSNVFSFNPYWAATAFFTPDLTVSWRLHYLWNAENSDPFVGFGARDSQAGQAVHANFAAAYAVLPERLRIGLNGYFLKQFTESKLNGRSISNSEEQVFAIGPGLVYHFSKHDHLFVNAYWETDAENRPEGAKLNLRFVHHFN